MGQAVRKAGTSSTRSKPCVVLPLTLVRRVFLRSQKLFITRYTYMAGPEVRNADAGEGAAFTDPATAPHQ